MALPKATGTIKDIGTGTGFDTDTATGNETGTVTGPGRMHGGGGGIQTDMDPEHERTWGKWARILKSTYIWSM
jgi:hypothetical protein